MLVSVTADCGGSNGARVRLWKLELQKLADETALVIRVHHYPPGTSKLHDQATDQAKIVAVIVQGVPSVRVCSKVPAPPSRKRPPPFVSEYKLRMPAFEKAGKLGSRAGSPSRRPSGQYLLGNRIVWSVK
jgi:hypothetical protein